MDAELTSHLGYERGDVAGHRSGNSRNGSTPKTVGTEIGDIELDQPRDRNSSFALDTRQHGPNGLVTAAADASHGVRHPSRRGASSDVSPVLR